MNNEFPLISIIVPVYNVEKYLHRCVDSILNQTYRNLEIILVDDGSPDRSGEICDEYAAKDGRIRVIHQENRGLSGARNAGLDICKGEYIAFVDSDDYIEPDMFQQLFTGINDVDLCGCGMIRETQAGEVLAVARVEAVCSFSGMSILRQHYTGNNGRLGITEVAVWGKLYRRRLFEQLRFRVGLLFEDVHLMPYYLSQCAVVRFIPYEGYHYLSTPNSITSTTDALHLKKCYEDCMKIWDDHERLYRNTGLEDLLQELYCTRIDKIITHFLTENVPNGCEKWSKNLLHRTVLKIMTKPIGVKRKLRYVLFCLFGRRGYQLLKKYF